MYPNVVLCCFLLATSATARPDLLRRDSVFVGPRGQDGDSPAAQAAASAAEAAAVAAVSASPTSTPTVDAYLAWSVSAASAQYARGESQMSALSARLASNAAQSSIVIQNKLVDPAITSVTPASSTFSVASARQYGIAFYAAARYKHEG